MTQHSARWPASVRIAVSVAFCGCLVSAAYWSVRFAWAEIEYRQETLSSVERATRLNPFDAKYPSWLAELQEISGQRPDSAWKQALSTNPQDATTWIRLALGREQRGDIAGAEKALLHAAAIDHQFDPKATLANFYFRQQRPDEFWRWVNQAVALDHSDARPLFALCWQMSGDPEFVRTHCVPDDPATYRKYLGFLTAEGKIDPAIPVFEKLSADLRPEDKDLLLGFCDVLLSAQKAASARAVWNRMSGAKLLPYPPSNDIVTDGDFRVDPRREEHRAFAWRLSQSDAVDYSLPEAPRALEITLSGSEPESLELLGQNFVVQPGHRYRLEYTFQTQGIPPNAGPVWRVVAGSAEESARLSSLRWKTESLVFRATVDAAAYLSLRYDRARGTTRIRGSIAVREIRIEELP